MGWTQVMRVRFVLCSYCVLVGLGLACLVHTKAVHAWTDLSLTSLKTATALETPVTVKFDEVPFKQAVESLCRQADLDVVWDEASLAEVGLDDDETVALSTGQPLALRRALALVLEPCYLTYELQGERQLHIISRRQAQDRMITATYNVRPLLKKMPADFDLPALIQKTVAPGQWQSDSTEVAGYMLLVDGELQVTQFRSVQRQVATLLVQLESQLEDE